jgi:hypothetical protein
MLELSSEGFDSERLEALDFELDSAGALLDLMALLLVFEILLLGVVFTGAT